MPSTPLKKRFLTLTTGLSVLVLLACTAMTPVRAQDEAAQEKKEASKATTDINETYRQLNLFGDVFERVRAQYVEEVGDKELVEAAINGMLTNLDPHSSYLNDEAFKEMQVQTKGEFGGLGIEVTMENGLIKVISPIDDTPAARAGVQAGDFITHLDNQPVLGLALNEAVDKMRGKVGTDIKITLRREGVAEPIELTLKRDVIRIKSVRHRVEGNVGYIRITSFNQNTDEGVQTAIKDIRKQLGSNLTGYILDLRNNPGGLLDQAIAVSDEFLDRGEIVSTRGRHTEDTKRDNATPGDAAEGLPIVVLINGGSASASEIVAGALQDHRRAILMGTKSFGKGSVQTLIPLPGYGAMRLTTARYYTPSGRSIQAKGIEPDIVVEAAKIEEIKSTGGMSESDLRGALSAEDVGEGQTPATPNLEKQQTPGKPEGDKGAAGEKSEGQGDYQLIRALDLLKGLSLYESQDAAVKPQGKPAASDAPAKETP